MKKAVFITYNQALTERVAFLLDQLQIKGFTQWPLVNGAGTETGEPRMGSHTWPEMNSATITIVEEEMVPLILKYVKALDEVICLSGSKIVSTFFQRFKAASQNFFRIDYVDKGFGVDFCNPMP